MSSLSNNSGALAGAVGDDSAPPAYHESTDALPCSPTCRQPHRCCAVGVEASVQTEKESADVTTSLVDLRHQLHRERSMRTHMQRSIALLEREQARHRTQRPLQVFIRDHRLGDNGAIVYRVEVIRHGAVVSLEKRYTDFRELSAALRAEFPTIAASVPSLPSRFILPSKSLDEATVRQRERQLHIFLVQVAAVDEFSRSEALRSFLTSGMNAQAARHFEVALLAAPGEWAADAAL